VGNVDLALESGKNTKWYMIVFGQNKAIDELQTQYKETRKKDNVIKLLVKNTETNRWRIIGLILGLLLVVFVALGLSRNGRRIKLYEKRKK
jgi:hypothetical protein